MEFEYICGASVKYSDSLRRIDWMEEGKWGGGGDITEFCDLTPSKVKKFNSRTDHDDKKNLPGEGKEEEEAPEREKNSTLPLGKSDSTGW